MARRWTCPICGGGVNGITRPRRDDVRRYCLDCSKRTGKLVERICPTLEAKREKKVESRKKKRATIAEKENGKWIAFDLDVRDLTRKVLALPTVATERKATKRPRTLPGITLRRSKRNWYTSGRATPWEWKYVVTIGTDRNAFLHTVIHEIVHLVLPNREWHSGLFRNAVAAAEREWNQRYPELTVGPRVPPEKQKESKNEND